MKNSLRRVCLTLVTASLLVVGFDYVTYAATGSSLLLGRSNTETATTTVNNTGAGAALNLHVSKAATAPFTTNGTGLVKNLYASRSASADSATVAGNAARLGGQTLTQVRAGIDATSVGGLTPAQIEQNAQVPAFDWSRTNASQGSVTGGSWGTIGIESGTVPINTTYQLTGSFSVACGYTSTAQTFTLFLRDVDRGATSVPLGELQTVVIPVASCGTSIPIPATTVALTATTDLIVGVLPTDCPGFPTMCEVVNLPTIASLNLTAYAVTKHL